MATRLAGTKEGKYCYGVASEIPSSSLQTFLARRQLLQLLILERYTKLKFVFVSGNVLIILWLTQNTYRFYDVVLVLSYVLGMPNDFKINLRRIAVLFKKAKKNLDSTWWDNEKRNHCNQATENHCVQSYERVLQTCWRWHIFSMTRVPVFIRYIFVIVVYWSI